MYDLGKRKVCFGMELLKPLKVSGRPSAFPNLPPDSSVVCGYDQGLGERMLVCDSLEDMQQLYDSYAAGGALTINWYTGEDVGVVMANFTIPTDAPLS